MLALAGAAARHAAALDPRTAARAAELFKALADPARIRILSLLAEGEQCVRRIAEAVGMSEPAVSHHLRVLRALRVVSPRRQGRHVFYRLDDGHVRSLLRQALEHVRHGPGASGEPFAAGAGQGGEP